MARILLKNWYVVDAEYRDAPKRTFGPVLDPDSVVQQLASRPDVIGSTVRQADENPDETGGASNKRYRDALCPDVATLDRLAADLTRSLQFNAPTDALRLLLGELRRSAEREPDAEAVTPQGDDLEDMTIGQAIRHVQAERDAELIRLRSLAVERGWQPRRVPHARHSDWWDDQERRLVWQDDGGWKAEGKHGAALLVNEAAALAYALGL